MMLTPKSATTYANAPVGMHNGSFNGITAITTSKGKAYRWEFKLDSGMTISVLSDGESPPTARNKSGKFIMALTGQPLVEDVPVDVNSFIGKRYAIIVVPDGDKTKIETFMQKS